MKYIILILLLLTACSESQFSEDKINIVCTTGMICDTAKNIGGDKVNVIGLMGPGVDPHSYQASEGDVFRLLKADVILYNGLHLEAKMAEIFENMEEKGVAVTSGMEESKIIRHTNFPDPHVWFDVKLWSNTVPVIRDRLIKEDPDNSDYYTSNAADYMMQLEELDSYVRDQANDIPESQRVLVTAHDAFTYFGKAYDFEVVGLQGVSTASESGIGDIEDLTDLIVKRRIKSMFVESSVSDRGVKAVVEATKSRGWDMTLGGELFSDAMGNKGTIEGTYIGMVRHNIDTIHEALK